ncbi:hypothetical protein RO3G_06996 [Lichtheimia corymbifera JMRC:FSU:9682]|uniref:WWE domain-containing protein n=1 Tax=Lichtheimia corymbifera JMRC:FSU:9682 TaxID=1263082 RepID=A0A068SJ43_9FUNG|nr:hypothetical protein RO3G_06996 [Lichtheimia corymbifera JMRC:FSU:9682]
MIPAEQQHPTNTTTVAFYPDHSHLMAPHYRYDHHRHSSYHHYDQRPMPIGQQQQQPSQQQHHVMNRKRLSTSKTATMLMDKPRKPSTVMPYPLRRPLLSPSSPERLLLLDEIIPVEAQKPSPSTSCSSSSTTSSSPSPRILQPPHTTSATSKPNTSTTHHLPPATPARTLSPPPMYYFTWLVFLHEKWVPFDPANQSKLEQTLTLGGTFVDVSDTHFPKVKRVRVFPKNNYLSYLGVKYRLSRIMQPDAWLDHKHLAATSSLSDDDTIDNSSNRENAGINGNHSGASPWIP